MKKLIPILIALILTACSDDSAQNTEPTPDPKPSQQKEPDSSKCDPRCVGNISYFCNDDGTEGQRDCGDPGCNQNTKTCNTTAPADVCNQNDVQCNGDSVETCVAGKWEKAKTPCPNGCKDGQCQELICRDDELQCNGDKLEICTQNEWTLKENCTYGCKDKQCLPQICTEGSHQCNGDKLEICSQNQWSLQEECPRGCENNQCKPETCTEPGTMIGDYVCDGEIITYKTCEPKDGVNVVVNHQAVTLCRESGGITHLTVCTDPNNDQVYIPFDWKTCAKSCTTTPETDTEYEYATCDDIHYGGPLDAECDATLQTNCDLVDKICVMNNLFYDCVAPCQAGDPDTIRCELNNDAQTVARKVSCHEFRQGVFGYGVLEETVCTGTCTNGTGCR